MDNNIATVVMLLCVFKCVFVFCLLFLSFLDYGPCCLKYINDHDDDDYIYIYIYTVSQKSVPLYFY